MLTENGWPRVDAAGCEWVDIPGTDVRLQIQKGQPLQILRAFAADFHAHIEPLRDADSACWTPTNSVATSNHLGGTAMDLNWNSHPFRVADAGFDRAKITRVRELLDFYEGTVFWANDWDTPKDAMHWQMGYGTYLASHTADFIARKIRPDGYSTYKRGTAAAPTGGLTAGVLATAMGGGVSADRYAALLPAFTSAMRAADITTPARAAMWCAQLGHESGGLRWMEEIADGSAYEGRQDLGNVQLGDGRRFKGRGPIQVTGRANYTACSRWAYTRGLVPTPTFFVDQPDQLASDQYGFIGPVWYWVAARPQLNQLSDAGDLDGATRAINGGLNGIEDRRQRLARCKQLGAQLLPTTTDKEDPMADTTTRYRSLYVDDDGNQSTFEADIPTYILLQDAKMERLVRDQARMQDQIAEQSRIITALGRIAGIITGEAR